MFTLRRETDYALQMLKILSKNKNQVESLSKIAKDTKISFLFLQKIARKLRLANIIKAHQGVEGGYQLLRVWVLQLLPPLPQALFSGILDVKVCGP